MIRKTPDTFTAATWNVYHGTPAKEAADVLDELVMRGVSLVLGNEFAHRELRAVFGTTGWHLYFHPRQYLIAWRPEVWTSIDPAFRGVELSSTAYYAKGSSAGQRSEAALGILSDIAGRTLTAMSYHTPAHVQVADQPPRRIQALRESAREWRALADAAHTRACLFGGDDNVDEGRGGRAWDFMRDRATGLRQVVAPLPTHGHPRRGRRIDDFRVRGLEPLEGWVVDGGGDHRAHGRTFRWS